MELAARLRRERCWRLFWIWNLAGVALSLPRTRALELEARKQVLDSDLQREPSHKYAYFIQAYQEPVMIERVLKMLRAAEPHALVFMLSDGGLNFTKMAERFGVRFSLAGVNIGMRHGERFLYRLGKAMAKCDCEYMVVLEEDTCIHSAPRHPPRGDVGGLPWTNLQNFGDFAGLLKKRGITTEPPPWGFVTGACGGSYYKVSSMMPLTDVRYGTPNAAIKDLIQGMPRIFEDHMLTNDVIGPALAYEMGLRVVPWSEVSENNSTFSTYLVSDATGTEAFEHKCRALIDLRGVEDDWDIWDWAVMPESDALARLPPDGDF